MRSCSDCPKRATCSAICPEIESQLPPEDGRPRAGLNAIDRSVAWTVQDHEDELTPRQRLVARLHHRFGLSEQEIADLLGRPRSSVGEMLVRIRKRACKKSRKTLGKNPAKTA